MATDAKYALTSATNYDRDVFVELLTAPVNVLSIYLDNKIVIDMESLIDTGKLC